MLYLFYKVWTEMSPHEKTACVFLTWTILQMEMDRDFKKMTRGRQGAILSPTPLRRRPYASHVPLKGVYD